MRESGFPEVVVSVVSHGHGIQLFQLINKLEALCTRRVGHVIVTVNTPEPDLIQWLRGGIWIFKLTIIQNEVPKGFGANHNAAFKHCELDYFCVVNPDIDFDEDPFYELICLFNQPLVGCVFPVQLDGVGEIQDYARKLPSPLAIFSRYFLPKANRKMQAQPDWVNGAFMLFPTSIFGQLDGFNERYFMYCEDVDICIRLQLAGYRLGQATAKVTHEAHRSSRINFQHLVWHVTSLFRLWIGTPYRKYSSSKPRK